VNRFRADWILPISDSPIPNGSVAIESGRIVSVGPAQGADAIDLGRAAVLPGLVNAHTHLELSYLRNRVPPARQFLSWVRVLMHARRQFPEETDPRIVSAAREAIAEARASGTALFGDVSNTLVDVPLLNDAGVPAQVFFELLRFNAPDPDQIVRNARARIAALPECPLIRVSLAPHAPYSVSSGLFAAIRRDLDADAGARSSVHLGESPEEVEFIKHGTGGWRILLEEFGAWTDDWRAPGCSPVRYLESLGFLDNRVLVVHGVQFSGEDLGRLRALGIPLVSCPRSNRYVGVGTPPLEAFYAMGVRVALGTDSLASVDDLNMFAELAAARQAAPRVSARRLLESATLEGARALGFEEDFGSVETGKRAALIGVQVPEGVTDVEEYLVSGIEPAAIRWLDETS
jgi:cytosine/adenosine deaminase-related metal-dependent hydrolase